jgi:hypothetical protein
VMPTKILSWALWVPVEITVCTRLMSTTVSTTTATWLHKSTPGPKKPRVRSTVHGDTVNLPPSVLQQTLWTMYSQTTTKMSLAPLEQRLTPFWLLRLQPMTVARWLVLLVEQQLQTRHVKLIQAVQSVVLL